MTDLNIDPATLTNVILSERSKRAIEENIRPQSVRSSVKLLCDHMKKQIVSRAFYGWLLYHRHFKTVSVRLIGLINCDRDCIEDEEDDAEDYQLDTISVSSDINTVNRFTHIIYILLKINFIDNLKQKFESQNNLRISSRNKNKNIIILFKKY